MSKKLISTFSMVAMICCLMMTNGSEVQAAEVESDICIDGSYLTQDSESTVTVYPRSRGVYMLNGSGMITNPGIGKVGASGSTVAHHTVNQIGVTVRVDRYVDGGWITYTSWNHNLYNTYYAGTSKIITVPRGYYYRVRTSHWAASDTAMGSTDGIWIA